MGNVGGFNNPGRGGLGNMGGPIGGGIGGGGPIVNNPGMGIGGGNNMGGPGVGVGGINNPGVGGQQMGGPNAGGNGGFGMGQGNNFGGSPFIQSGQAQAPKSFQQMTWSYLDDKGVFQNYDNLQCNIIENAYSNNQPSVELTINGQQYIVNFKSPFSQFSKGGQGIEREVRRNDGSSQPILERGQAKWEWQDDDQRFKEYEPKACLLIERAYQNLQKHVIVWGKNSKAYFIDLSDRNKPVQENEITHYKRSIRRVPN